MYRFELPDIGEGIVEAEIIEWKVHEGDQVQEEQILVEIMTDKANIEIPSPCAGRVHRIHYQVGEVAPVGAVLIEIEEGEKSVSQEPAPPAATDEEPSSRPDLGQETPPRHAAQKTVAGTPEPPVMPPRPGSRQKAGGAFRGGKPTAVPAVRELASRLGVDLNLIRGTGPDGRIMRRDVEQAIAGASPAHSDTSAARLPSETPIQDADDWERRPLRGLRRAIARRMIKARQSAAHFTYVNDVDMTHLVSRSITGQRDVEPPSPLAFIASACVRVLGNYLILNSSIDDENEEIILKKKVHLGIATATDEGLLVPVIRDASRLSVLEMASAVEDLARGAREKTLTPSELKGSTFTITSLGKLGGIMSTPILNHPEVAILGVNAIREVPRFWDGTLQARKVMNLSISVDHRITDGLTCARFIQDVKRILEEADFPDLFDNEGP
jgi:pyruvate dehydrogenase E2 component (dihydrolipoamide acetyltransferase)